MTSESITELQEQRARRSQLFLLVVAFGLLVFSFGTWEIAAGAPVALGDDGSPWILHPEQSLNAWSSGLTLFGQSLNNGILVVLGTVAILVGAARFPSVLPLFPALGCALSVFWVVLFAWNSRKDGHQVGDAVVVVAGMLLLATALIATMPATGPAEE